MYQTIINELNTYIAGELSYQHDIVYEWYFAIDLLQDQENPGDILYEAYCMTRLQIQELLPESFISDYWQDSNSIGFTLNLLSQN